MLDAHAYSRIWKAFSGKKQKLDSLFRSEEEWTNLVVQHQIVISLKWKS